MKFHGWNSLPINLLLFCLSLFCWWRWDLRSVPFRRVFNFLEVEMAAWRALTLLFNIVSFLCTLLNQQDRMEIGSLPPQPPAFLKSLLEVEGEISTLWLAPFCMLMFLVLFCFSFWERKPPGSPRTEPLSNYLPATGCWAWCFCFLSEYFLFFGGILFLRSTPGSQK